MIQDINDHKIDIVFDGQAELEKEDLVIAFCKGEVYLKKQKKGEEKCFVTCGDLLPVEYKREAMEKYKKDAVYLLRIDGKKLFLLPDKYLEFCPQAQRCSISVFREKTKEDQAVLFAMITAWHFYEWYEKTKFCGACGIRLRHRKAERAMECPICGNIIYPRIYPAVIVGIYKGDRILLTKRVPEAKYFALVSGYCEVGETLEETARREVKEETGLEIGNLTYYKSQPWAISQSVLAGFFAKLDGDEHIHIDRSELAEAKWVKRDKLGDCYSKNGISLTAEMIEYFYRHPEEF